jgi:hypothetical protein
MTRSRPQTCWATNRQVVRRHQYPLTDQCYFDILHSDPGWCEDPNAIRSIEAA